jgi:DNA (cytosine-5)-methyltransferase 1
MAGFSVVGAVEIDSLAVETYRENHPEVHLWSRDIRKVTAPTILKELKLKRGQLDLLAGCPPCQGFSTMPRLNGGRRIVDKRNGLVLDFLRLVKGLRPKAVMMENVPGLARSAHFRRLMRELERLGYCVSAEVKDARHYAVPQRRRRLIVIGAKGVAVKFAPRARCSRSVRSALAQLSSGRARTDLLHRLPETRSKRVRDLISQVPKNGGSRAALGDKNQLDCHKLCDGFKDVYGRMKWDDVAPTITSGCCNPSKGRFLHPSKNRAITVREAAILQTFPVTYYFSTRRGKYPAAEMVGNALPPEFVRRHALEVVGALKGAQARANERCTGPRGQTAKAKAYRPGGKRS